MAGDMGGEDPLEKEMATHSSSLAWEIPWTEGVWGYTPRGHQGLDMTWWWNNSHKQTWRWGVVKHNLSNSWFEIQTQNIDLQ